MSMNIVVCGGGNMGHAIAGNLSLVENTKISILTRNPLKWSKNLTIQNPDGSICQSKELYVTSEAKEVIPNANIIIITVPNFGIKEVIEQIAPFYNSETWIGSVQCAGGFFWTLHNKLKNVKRTFGFQRVPYICRTIEYGKSVHITGNKNSIDVYYNHDIKNNNFKETLETLFNLNIVSCKHYLEVGISNSNPILHPSRLYSMFKNWNENKYFERELFFYEDWDDESSDILLACDNELSNIIKNIPIDLSHIKSIKKHYEVNNAKELTQKLKSIEAFKGIKTSMIKLDKGYIPDIKNRYFTEDVPYGLLLIKGLALLTNTDVPNIDRLIFWAQNLLKMELLVDDKTLGKDSYDYPLPQSFNITNINQLV